MKRSPWERKNYPPIGTQSKRFSPNNGSDDAVSSFAAQRWGRQLRG
jgi:hypothetical protein